MNEIRRKIDDNKKREDESLRQILSESRIGSGKVANAMRYAVLGGGKRIRSFLIREYTSVIGGSLEAANALADAIEIGHAASLIHDDLPCMDDSGFRHGMLSCHRKYGEDIAVLAGDALLTFSYELVSNNKYLSPEVRVYAIETMAKNAGIKGMCQGQEIDLSNDCNGYEDLCNLYDLKTGTTIKTAMIFGCMTINKIPNKEMLEQISSYSQKIGRIFQFTDDILDGMPCSETGKESGVDLKNGTKTVLTYRSIKEVYEEIDRLIEEASIIYPNTLLAEFPIYLKNRKK